jgi:hypothetical protein
VIDDNDLQAIEDRVFAAGELWRLDHDERGIPFVRLRLPSGTEEDELRVMRETELAAEGDVSFIAHAADDIRALVAAVRSRAHLSADKVGSIDRRVSMASPGPWKLYLESEGGLGGCNVISVSSENDEPDMYLWVGSDLAPDAIWEFVAAARQDIPRLLMELHSVT